MWIQRCQWNNIVRRLKYLEETQVGLQNKIKELEEDQRYGDQHFFSYWDLRPTLKAKEVISRFSELYAYLRVDRKTTVQPSEVTKLVKSK